MYSNILCAQRENSSHSFFIEWLLGGTTFLQCITPCARRSPLLCWICTGGWETPVQRALSGGEGGKSAGFFFSAYETNVWHSTEHCSAVGLSVNRRQYARACWRLIWHWLPRNFKRKEELYTSPLLLLFFWGILCWCIPALICNQLIAELKKNATDVITQEFSHLHVWYVSLF